MDVIQQNKRVEKGTTKANKRRGRESRPIRNARRGREGEPGQVRLNDLMLIYTFGNGQHRNY